MNKTGPTTWGDRLSTELRLLCTCISPMPMAERAGAIRRMSTDGIDWGRFCSWVARHRVEPLVFAALRKTAWDLVPEEAKKGLKAKVLDNRYKAMNQARALIHIVRRLEGAGIPVIVLKGIPLSLRLHKDIAMRHAGDIDILVPVEGMQEADQILRSSGIRRVLPNGRLSPKQYQAILRRRSHFNYWDGKGVTLEVHWKLGSVLLERVFQSPELFKEKMSIGISGRLIACPGERQLLPYLLLHGLQHFWFRLKWLADVGSNMAETSTSEKLEALLSSPSITVKRGAAIGSLLCHHLLGCPLPLSVARYAGIDPKVHLLALESFHRIGALDPGTRQQTVLQRMRDITKHMQIDTSLRYKIGYLANCLYPPALDFETFHLPDRLFPLYYFLRVISWFQRRVLKKGRS